MNEIRTSLRDVWKNMRQRCQNEKHKNYAEYGGRGIKVCERWNEFKNFLADLATTYKRGLWLERRNNDGDYSPGNCFWATPKQQANNRRNARRLQCYSGPRGEKTVAEWSSISGTKAKTIYERLRCGWDYKEAVFGKH